MATRPFHILKGWLLDYVRGLSEQSSGAGMVVYQLYILKWISMGLLNFLWPIIIQIQSAHISCKIAY
jgi:hypothetical protein